MTRVVLIALLVAVPFLPLSTGLPQCDAPCTPHDANPGAPVADPPIETFLYIHPRNPGVEGLALATVPSRENVTAQVDEPQRRLPSLEPVCTLIGVPGERGSGHNSLKGEPYRPLAANVNLSEPVGTLTVYMSVEWEGPPTDAESIEITSTARLIGVTGSDDRWVAEGGPRKVAFHRDGEQTSFQPVSIELSSDRMWWPGGEGGIRIEIELCRPYEASLGPVVYHLLMSPTTPARLVWSVANPGWTEGFTQPGKNPCAFWAASSPFDAVSYWNHTSVSVNRLRSGAAESISIEPPYYGYLEFPTKTTNYGICRPENGSWPPGDYTISMLNRQDTHLLSHTFTIADSPAAIPGPGIVLLIISLGGVATVFWRRTA